MMSSRTSYVRASALLLLVLACCASLAPVSAQTMDETQVQALLEAAKDLPTFGWTADSLRAGCNAATRATGIQSCNETGFVTSIYLAGGVQGVAPAAFSKLTALKSISLFYWVNGTLPSAWSSLTQLESISIGDYVPTMRLTGAIPESWSSMTLLKSLSIKFTNNYNPTITLIASTPPSWLGNLEAIDITCAYWPNAVLPASIGTSGTLTSIKLFRCQFKGSFPTGLLSNTVLTSLYLGFDSPAGFGTGYTLPSDFSAMTNLTLLTLSGASFSGSLPTAYPPMLDSLVISYLASLQGTIPQSIVDHPTLTSFFLAGMPSITGALPGPTNPATSKLAVYSVSTLPGITGTLPASVLGLEAYISLQEMPSLSGPFPTVASVSASSCRITQLNSGHARFKGSALPVGLLENCASLEEVAFLDAGFTGSIPAFTAAPSITKIQLDSNSFSGTLPVITFAQTSASIYCNYCNLTGTIPPIYFNTTAFSNRGFAGNNLDLCSNAADILATGFVNQTRFSGCQLVGQTPRECGCPDIWPTNCFQDRPMAPDCNNLPPDTLISPSPTRTPTNAAPSAAIPSFALLMSLLVIYVVATLL